MAMTTVTREMAAQYKEFRGRVGETIQADELRKVQAAHADDESSTEAEATDTETDTEKVEAPKASKPARASKRS